MATTSLPVYLDYAAATPVDGRVIKEMISCLSLEGTFANSAARDHVYGWQAADKVETARGQVAELVGASPLEITFTSGATESSNLAILGLARALKEQGDPRRHLITSLIEHKAVLECCRYLESHGYRVTWLTPLPDGSISPEQVAAALEEDTFLVSVAEANSVVGTISDVRAIAMVCKARGVYFHTDMAQSVGYTGQVLKDSAIALASLTPEKLCGPKGVGALYISRALKVPVAPLILGGGQERGLRSGTVATHQVAGMGKAFEIMLKEGKSDYARLNALRDKLKQGLSALGGVKVNGSEEHHLPGVLSVTFEGVEGRTLLPSLRGVAASTGSACSSASLTPSYVLKALGLSDADAFASVRLSLGRFTTEEEVDKVLDIFKKTLPGLRQAFSATGD